MEGKTRDIFFDTIFFDAFFFFETTRKYREDTKLLYKTFW